MPFSIPLNAAHQSNSSSYKMSINSSTCYMHYLYVAASFLTVLLDYINFIGHVSFVSPPNAINSSAVSLIMVS